MPTATKNIRKHTNAIRRNTELHEQVCAAIAEQQERAGLTQTTQIRAMRKHLIGWRTI